MLAKLCLLPSICLIFAAFVIAEGFSFAQEKEDWNRAALPIPQPPFKGKIGRTVKDSVPDFPKEVTAPKGAQNVLLILTDDVGASAEGSLQGTTNEVATTGNGVKEDLPFLLSMIDRLGGPMTYNHYPVGWAHAMDSPMQWTKQVASHFGGTANGMVISWPARIKDKGGIRPQFSHVIDITPTIYEAVGITSPEIVDGVKQKPLEGVSLVYTFDNATAPTRHNVQCSARAADPLPSWNDTGPKKAIVAFVEKVTKKGSPDFVPPPERIAVFDNDGTLWPENPVPFQVAYVLDALKADVAKKPELKQDPMVDAALTGDLGKLLAGPHHDGLLRVIGLTHAGMTTVQFQKGVENWLATARHPRYGKPYDQLTYQPMQEVLAYLRANGFKTFIVSGGGADFMRVWSERVYGIPPEQVVGSSARTKYELRPSGPVLIKTMDYLFVDDKEGKPVGIHQFIGRRPIACFGNSDGDKAMLEYTTIGNPRASFGLIVHHTDAQREYAYDAHPKSSGKLAEALEDAPQRGWTVVDMRNDWKRVFALESGRDSHGATPHWGYSGKTGPAHWADLNPDWAIARTGREQSPIDITGAREADLPAIEFDYRPSRVNIVNNGHAIQVNCDKGSSIKFDGKAYQLKQFHFHAPSEHTIGGRSSDIEMHLVHESAGSELAVISVMLKKGATNRAYEPVWRHLPDQPGPEIRHDETVNPFDLLPARRGYYTYSGSLTTPPCSEGVKWFVLVTPVELSADQVAASTKIYSGNNRPVQPLNERNVERSK